MGEILHRSNSIWDHYSMNSIMFLGSGTRKRKTGNISKMAEFRFKSNQQLMELTLDDVSLTGKTLGTGSFGSVFEVS